MTRIESAAEQFLVALRSLEERSLRAHREIATGRRVSSVSDDPAQAPALLELQTRQSAVDQIRQNLGRVKAEVDTAESALEQAVLLMDQARAFASQGASTTEAATKRPILARAVQGLLDQMTGLSESESEGRPVFGDEEAARLIQHPNGTTFAVAKTSTEIFDSVLASLQGLQTALENNDDEAIHNSIDDLHAAGDHIGDELSWYGDLQTRMNAAIGIAEKFQVQAAIQLGQMRDADLPASITELTQTETQRQATMGAQAQMPRYSLFDYLR